MLSIRGKLVLMLVSALVTAGVVASVATYYSTRMEFSSLFDAQLKHTALELIEGGNIEVNSVALIGQAPQQQISVQVYDAADNRLYVARSQHPLPVAEIPGFPPLPMKPGTSGGSTPPLSAHALCRRRSPLRYAPGWPLPPL